MRPCGSFFGWSHAHKLDKSPVIQALLRLTMVSLCCTEKDWFHERAYWYVSMMSHCRDEFNIVRDATKKSDRISGMICYSWQYGVRTSFHRSNDGYCGLQNILPCFCNAKEYFLRQKAGKQTEQGLLKTEWMMGLTKCWRSDRIMML